MPNFALNITPPAGKTLAGVTVPTITRNDTGAAPAGVSLPLTLALSGGLWTGSFSETSPPSSYSYAVLLAYTDGTSVLSNPGTLFVDSPAVNLQIKAAPGQSLYLTATRPTGQLFNVNTRLYEPENDANWQNYVIPLSESAPNTGIYVGSAPSSLPPGLVMLAVRTMAGSAPAATDLQYGGREPLILALDWSGNEVNSLTPLGSWQNNQVQLPEQTAGTSLMRAAQMLDALMTARLKLASRSVASVNIDGNATTFTNPAQLDESIQYWQKQVALLSGQRKRIFTMNV